MIRRILINLHDWLFRGPPAAALPADWTWEGDLPTEEPLPNLLRPADARCWDVSERKAYQHHYYGHANGRFPYSDACRHCGAANPRSQARAKAGAK